MTYITNFITVTQNIHVTSVIVSPMTHRSHMSHMSHILHVSSPNVTYVNYIKSVTILTLVLCLRSALLLLALFCLLLSLVIIPTSVIQSFVPHVLQSCKLIYLSLEYSSVFSSGIGSVFTYSPSFIMPWKQLALSLKENILSLYFCL